VLIQQSDIDSFWVLSGGCVEMPESAEDALRREMREELHLGGRNRPVAQDSELYKSDSVVQTEYELGTKLRHIWQPLNSLKRLDIKPTFLYDVLPAIPNVPNYIVHRDNI
jgi:8-oxo-dGTP pyrophosphatase MutT (NUDIX family)